MNCHMFLHIKPTKITEAKLFWGQGQESNRVVSILQATEVKFVWSVKK